MTNSSPPRRLTVCSQPARPIRSTANRVLETGGDLAQQLVADDVAEVVVHHLEAVEVDEEDGEVHFLEPFVALDGVLEAVEEHGAVGESGEAVAEGGGAKLLFHGLALGDVAEAQIRP